MIWFILAIIFGILVIYIIHDEGIGWFTSIAGGLFCGAVGWFLCFVLTGAIASGIGNVTNSIKYVANPKESHDIVALQDNIYATCFRNADGYLKITYLYTDMDEAGEESYKNETIEGESAQFYLKDDVVPHVDAYKPVFINKAINFIFGSPIFYSNKYNIYVPEDTIKMDYNVDLK